MYSGKKKQKQQEVLIIQKLEKDVEARSVEIERCRRDPWYWITRWVWTKDEHDRRAPFKRFPDKPYLKEITRFWQREKLLLIPKSRQMMLTWLIIALYLHDTQFFPGRLNIFQCKKDSDATILVRRAKIIYDKQPEWMRQSAKYKSSPHGELSFPEIESRIMGVPQGANQLRMHTLSGLFVDEAAFQPQLEETWTSAKPAVDGGDCRVTMVSSPNPSFFEMLVHDKIKST
jgi:hypothetical protein